jgi:DNA-binding response OmpR family regulator
MSSVYWAPGWSMPRILLADDDLELGALLKEYLEAEGFAVELACDGNVALRRALGEDFDLVVLDIMMPGKNGLEVLRELRATRLTPVLVLTARGEDSESILGLELGADDYLGKPCNPKVLTAHLRAILRRSESAAESIDKSVRWIESADLRVHPGRRRVLCGGHPVSLTSTEFSILEALIRCAGRTVAKKEISHLALGRPMGRFDRSLDMHISNLRRKLGPLPGGEERIKTVRGVGYQYVNLG